MREASIPRGERRFLDTARWVSALAVAAGHAIGLAVTNSRGAGYAEQVAAYLADLRHGAVMVFFALSGYLVGGSIVTRPSSFDWVKYAAARFSRIYIVLIPAIFLISAIDFCSIHLIPHNPIYTQVWPSGVLGGTPLALRYAATNVTSTIFSLESFLSESMGSGGQLWSLGYEWLFYIAFPLLIWPPGLAEHRLRSTVAIALSIVALLMVGRLMFAAFWVIWLTGAAARYAAERFETPPWLAKSAGIVAVAALLASPLFDHRFTSPVIGMAFAVFLSRHSPRERGVNAEIDRRLAGCSYSLYVVHLPVMCAIASIAWKIGVLPVNGRKLDAISLSIIFVMLLGSGFTAIVFEHLFERRTPWLRQLLIARWDRSRVRIAARRAARVHSA